MCMYTSLGISMFKYTQLQDILVRVVKNASIPGFLSAYSGCTFDTTGMFNNSVCTFLYITITLQKYRLARTLVHSY